VVEGEITEQVARFRNWI